jgi:hypothetical protein
MMENNDYSIIKPVENLQNVGAMTPIDRQAEKKRRQNQQKQNRTASQQGLLDEHDSKPSGPGETQAEQGSIDYRA